MKTEDEIALQNLAAGFGIDEASLVGTVEGAGWQLLPAAKAILARELPSADLLADAAGGDVDPVFGVDPEDSMRLLELRNAIDEVFGWASEAHQEHGDYVARVHQVGEALRFLRSVESTDDKDARIAHLEKQLRTQRAELRRFNREARARREGNVPLHVTQDRWLSKLLALEQKTATGTASQADLHAIMRLKRFLGTEHL